MIGRIICIADRDVFAMLAERVASQTECSKCGADAQLSGGYCAPCNEREDVERKQLWRLALGHPRRPVPTPRAKSPQDFGGAFDELRAARAGRDLGRRFCGDPYRAARAQGIRVERVPELRNDARPTIAILGRYWDVGDGFIQLSAQQSRLEEQKTLAHELGHAAGIAEAYCDVFARAFLAEQPESPAVAHARAQDAWDALRRGK